MMSKFLNKFPLIPHSRQQITFMLLKRPFHGSLNKELFETKKFALADAPRLGYATFGRKFNEITNLPTYVWPNIFKTAKGFFLVVEIVSGIIAEGDYKALDGLVTPDVIDEVRVGVRCLNLKQFTQLSIRQEDIMYTFPYNIEIIDSEDKESLIIEITMVYHVVHGLPAFRARFIEDPPSSKELWDSVSIVNYRFRRDFKRGLEPDWIINGLNHVQPKPQ